MKIRACTCFDGADRRQYAPQTSGNTNGLAGFEPLRYPVPINARIEAEMR